MNDDGLDPTVERRLRDRFRSDAQSWAAEPVAQAVMERVRGQRQAPVQRGLLVRMVTGAVAITLISVGGLATLTTRPPGEPLAPAAPGAERSEDARVCYGQQHVPMQSPDPEELDTQIEAAGGQERMLSKNRYAGSAEGAARAFGGVLGEPRSPDYEWVDVATRHGISKLLLRRFESAAGIPVWFASGWSRPVPCGPGPTNTPRPTLDSDGPRPSTSFELYTHCGLDRSLIHFDGSYWRALSEPSGPLKDPFDQGTMTLLSADRAEYASDSGATVLLERRDERPSFVPCR